MVDSVEGEGEWASTTVEAACSRSEVGGEEEESSLEDDSYEDLNSLNSAQRAASSDLRAAISALGAEEGKEEPGGTLNLGAGGELTWEQVCCTRWTSMLF